MFKATKLGKLERVQLVDYLINYSLREKERASENITDSSIARSNFYMYGFLQKVFLEEKLMTSSDDLHSSLLIHNLLHRYNFWQDIQDLRELNWN